MAKKAAKDINFSLNSVALEDDITSMSQDVKQEVIDVTSFSDAGPRRVVGNYDYSYGLSGADDFASGQSDATIYGLVGSTGVASAFDPTGATAGANDPNYDSTSVVLESYSIKGAVGAAVTFDATVQGNAALARAVA
mgnify:FL=1